MKKHVGADAQEKMATQVAQFGKLPQACDACQKEFDKKNKEMAMTWSVVVREKENKVNLYCPQCWNDAHRLLEQIKRDMADKQQLQELGELNENKT